MDGSVALLVCDAGAVRACAELADSATRCDVCGCGTGMTCSGTGCSDEFPCECVTPQPVGAPCESDLDCESGSCSSFARICRVAVGATCTESNCDYCETYADGSSYCSRLCTDGTGLCDGGLCLGFGDIDHYTCSAACSGPGDPSCGGECRATASGDEYYCSCPRASCTRLEEDHAPLAPCAAYGSTHCASGACLGRTICGAVDCFTWGYCSDACTSDADCGEEGVCADLPCEGADTPTCGLQCLPRCEADRGCYGRGNCTSLPGASGAVVDACFVAPG